MADPRLSVAFDGIGAETASFMTGGSSTAAITYLATATGGSAAVGLAVTLVSAGTVSLAADGQAVIGKLLKVESDGVATVQTGGFCKLAGGTGASLTLGKKIVGALGAASACGYIREVATATAAELGVCRGAIIDAGTTTAVVVRL